VAAPAVAVEATAEAAAATEAEVTAAAATEAEVTAAAATEAEVTVAAATEAEVMAAGAVMEATAAAVAAAATATPTGTGGTEWWGPQRPSYLPNLPFVIVVVRIFDRKLRPLWLLYLVRRKCCPDPSEMDWLRDAVIIVLPFES
jgi:hypothetical protein